MPRDDMGGSGGGRPSLNVLGGRLETCSTKPMTGFFRDGCCDTAPEDVGSHTVCVVATDAFLQFSKARGNVFRRPCRITASRASRRATVRVLVRPPLAGSLGSRSSPQGGLAGHPCRALAYRSLADLKRFAVDLA